MTGKERMERILRHEPVDRVGLYEHFWNDTQKAWTEQGHLRPGENIADHFGFDMDECWAFDMTADLDFVPKVVAETADTVTFLDGNGAVLKRHKLHDSTPEHVDFTVREREDWEKVKPLLLEPDRRRIAFASYRRVKEECRKAGRFFVWSGVNVFKCMHPLCGHENMLAGMALDPDWVRDMATTYARLIVELQKILFEEEGPPDGIWYYEDMGYKGSPFMSPKMFRKFYFPFYKELCDYAHSRGLHVWLHCCGDAMKLLDQFILAGFDVLHPIQKYAMDETAVMEKYGGKIAFWSGMDLQQILPFGSQEDVRQEVHHLVDTFYAPQKTRTIFTVSNRLEDNVPVENLEAFIQEVYAYTEGPTPAAADAGCTGA